jgi:nickel/cobalt transporter (NicO) family protein
MMRRPLRRALLLSGVVATVLSAPATAIAHPLGNFTVNRYAGIELAPGEVRIEYVLDMAEIPTVQVRAAIDTDADGTLTDPERVAWAARTGLELVANLTLTVDGRAVPLDVVSSSMRFRPGQGGLDILRLEATFAGPVGASGELAFADANFADRIGWSEVTATGTDGTAVARSSVPAHSVSNALLSYPPDLLASPLDVREATLSFRPGAGAPAAAATGGVEANASRPDVTGGAFAGLVRRTGPFMLVALLLAFGFGALHALGPGHGKTLMAAYLVGAGGRARHAIAVGGSVAVMHTASVLALGFVVLMVTEVFAPERVYPWLGLVSGVIAFALGASLLVARLSSWGGRHAGPDHRHANADGAAGHDRAHPHPAPTEVLSRRSLTALAVAGGLLPSPTALVVLLAAVALHRIAYGLALIGAFSLGLATALVVVGLVALRARVVVAGRMSGRTTRLVPVLSAASISLLGLVLTFRGFGQI